ncbi:MAG TPA: hypothetical protein VFS51_04005, partial [Gemmatimonadales bacterium]|nr:hypothetical protein [Gemmatimonadales bacterium]
MSGQELREISSATRLRKEPQGITLVSLPAGTSVTPGRTRGNWHEVVVEGWVFSRSTAPTRRDGFDLVVTATDGENIRRSPNGEIVGRVRTGTLLFKEEVRGDWTRVRRAGWVPRETIASPAPQPDTGLASQAYAVQPQGQPVQSPAPAVAVGEQTDRDRVEVGRETPVYVAPDGGQYGTLQPGAQARVLGRSGEWTRVQIEGWVRQSHLQTASTAALSGITAAEVRSDPPKYVGRTVDWRVELIAVQEA